MGSEVSCSPQLSSEPGRREEMPSEDSLAEPVPTSHFTGQQGQGPRMGVDSSPAVYSFLSLQQLPDPECHVGAKHQVGTGATQK